MTEQSTSAPTWTQWVKQWSPSLPPVCSGLLWSLCFIFLLCVCELYVEAVRLSGAHLCQALHWSQLLEETRQNTFIKRTTVEEKGTTKKTVLFILPYRLFDSFMVYFYINCQCWISVVCFDKNFMIKYVSQYGALRRYFAIYCDSKGMTIYFSLSKTGTEGSTFLIAREEIKAK